MVTPWRPIKGAEPDAIKVASPVLNGGDEETGLLRPRLVATQLRQQVSASVRRCYPHVSEVNDKKRKEALQAACACPAMAAIVHTSRFMPYQRSVVGHHHDNNAH